MGEERQGTALKNQLIIMARRPELGKGKTRLASSIGVEKAFEVYKYLLNLTLDSVTSEKWTSNLFLTGQADFHQDFGIQEFDQAIGTLGEKMKAAFVQFSSSDKLIMIGTDCPDITKEIIAKAYKDLDDNDLVFGPSQDGGYYLIGMRTFFPEILEGIPWSTEVVLEKSIEICEKTDKKFALLGMLNDIDTLEDLQGSSLKSTFNF